MGIPQDESTQAPSERHSRHTCPSEACYKHSPLCYRNKMVLIDTMAVAMVLIDTMAVAMVLIISKVISMVLIATMAAAMVTAMPTAMCCLW